MQYIAKKKFSLLSYRIFMNFHCVFRDFFPNMVSMEWLNTINLSSPTDTQREITQTATH